MELTPPLTQYLTGDKPSHSPRTRLAQHINFLPQTETEAILVKHGYLSKEGKPTKKAMQEGLLDKCEGKILWKLSSTRKVLLNLTRKTSVKAKAVPKPLTPKVPERGGPVWTDLENIGTYFGVGKNKVGTWLDQLKLRSYKAMPTNESGDVDMLDVARSSQEKFKLKVPTEKALERGIATMELIEYTQKGKEKSFEKYSWNLEMVKAILVKAGHPLDTERKLLLRGKGKNGNIQVDSLAHRGKILHGEWKKLYANPKTRDASWRVFDKTPRGILIEVEKIMARPRYLQDKLYLKEK